MVKHRPKCNATMKKVGNHLSVKVSCPVAKIGKVGKPSTKSTHKKTSKSKSKGTSSIGKYKGVSIGKKAMVLAKSECKGMNGSDGKDCVKRAKENWKSMGKEEKIEYTDYDKALKNESREVPMEEVSW